MAAQDPLQYDVTSQYGYLLRFNRNYDPSGLGLEFYVDSIDGWDSPNMRQNILPRSGQEGGVPAESFYDHRVMVVNGYCWAKNPDDLWAARSMVAACSQASDADGTLIVYEPTQAGGPKQCAIRRMDKIHFDKNDGTDGCMFQLNIVGPDPRKYSTTVTQVNIVPTFTTLVNAGDMKTWPKFIFTGNTTAAPIYLQRVLDDAIMAVHTTLAPSDTLVVDFATKTVTLNGALRYDLIDNTSVWWSLFPGNTTISSSGVCVVQYRSAWS